MQINSLSLSAILFFVLLAHIACKEAPPKIDDLGRANAPAQTNNAPMSLQTPEGADQTPSSGKIHEGIIQETIDVKDYTYIRFKDQQGLEHWAAVLKGKFDSGKKIVITESIVMKDFHSPTLGKTFDSIVFGNVANGDTPSPGPVAQPDLPAGHPPINNTTPTN